MLNQPSSSNIEQVKECISKGNMKKAFELLQNIDLKEEKNTIILLSGQWNKLYNSILAGIINNNSVEENDISSRLLNTLDNLIEDIKPYFKNEAPKPKKLIKDKNGNLLGRELLLKKLHETFCIPENVIALKGISGIGKTTLVQHYCHNKEALKMFDSIYWINLSGVEPNNQNEIERLQNVFVLHFMKILTLSNVVESERFEKVKEYLSSNTQEILLVLDNVNDKNLILKNLSWLRNLNIYILLTTYADIQDIETINVEAFSEEDAIFFFKEIIPDRFIDEEIISLVRTLQYHTLLIETCAKILKNDVKLIIEDIVKAAKTHKLETLFFENIVINDNTQNYNSIKDFLFSIIKLSSLNEAEKLVLSYFSVLLSTDYPLNLLDKWFNFSESFGNSFKLSQVLPELNKKGWLQEKNIYINNKKEVAYQCHILLRYVIFQQLEINISKVSVFLKAIHKDTDYDKQKDWIDQVEFIKELEQIIAIFPDNHTIIANIYSSLRYLYDSIGEYTKALEYAKECIYIFENTPNVNNEDLSNAYSAISITYNNLGKYEEALEYNLKDIKICKKIFKKNDLSFATSFNNIGSTYNKLGNYDKALEYHFKAINILQTKSEIDNITLAIYYDNVSAVYQNQKDYAKDLEYSLKALEIRKKELKENNSDLISSYYSVAQTYYYLKNYKDAKNLIDKAVSEYEKFKLKNNDDYQNYLKWQKLIDEALAENLS